MADAIVKNNKIEMGKDTLPISSLSHTISQQWLLEKSQTLKPISYDKYESIVTRFIEPFLSDHPIDTLNEEIVNEYLRNIEDKGLSKSMIKIIKIALKGIYRFGEDHYHLNHIDFTTVKTTVVKKKKEVLDKQEEHILYDYCRTYHDSLGVSIMLCLYGGLKFSEICALRCSDVDFNQEVIHVSKKLQRSVSHTSTGDKTVMQMIELEFPEKREVAMADAIVFYLKDYMKDMNKDCYLLSKGKAMKDQRSFFLRLKKLGQKNGFEVNFTILRNTCIQRCISARVDINIIMASLGLNHLDLSIEDIVSSDHKHNKQEMTKIIDNQRF